MRFTVRTVSGLLLACSLALLPAAGNLHAAPATREASGKVPGETSLGGVGVLFKLNLLSTLAADCHTTTSAVTAALAAGGKSVLAICQATDPSATVDGLTTALLAAARSTLDATVNAGRMTADQETALLGALQAHLADWLTTPLDPMAARKAGTPGSEVKLDSLVSILAAACQTTSAALDSAMKAGGKSILAICQATNPAATVEGLVNTLLAGLKTKLDAVVAAGSLTAAQETDMITVIRAKLADWITTPLAPGMVGKSA